MLTSFFGKSNPVNYLLLGIFILVGYLVAVIKSVNPGTALSVLLESFLLAAACVFCMLLLDFMIRKNDLTRGNTFSIFLFSCFSVALSAVFFNKDVLLANIFTMLALRRIFSLPSEKNTEKKILDASIYITLASLFYFPAIGFIVFLFLAILRKPGLSYKWLIIPFVGGFLVFILTTTFYFLKEDSFQWAWSWFQLPSFNFKAYNGVHVLIPVTILIAVMLWAGAHKFVNLGALSKKEKPRGFLLLTLMGLTLVISLASPEKTGAELIFILTPLSILAANYIEFRGKEGKAKGQDATYWFKEILLWSALVLAVSLFLV